MKKHVRQDVPQFVEWREYNKQVHHHIIRLVFDAITKWRNFLKPSEPLYLPPKYKTLFQAQTIIGLDQLLKGRFATEWSLVISCTNPFIAHCWVSYTIRIIWQAFYDVWKSHQQK
jgi:hypothetical protein